MYIPTINRKSMYVCMYIISNDWRMYGIYETFCSCGFVYGIASVPVVFVIDNRAVTRFVCNYYCDAVGQVCYRLTCH